MAYGYPPILAVDFDGVIKKSTTFDDYDSPLMENCKNTLRLLKSMGCKLILWTCREGIYLEYAKDYLKKHGIYELFDAFNSDVQQQFPTSGKVYADYYIDDHNLEGFPGWDAVFDIISNDPYFTGTPHLSHIPGANRRLGKYTPKVW